MKKLASICPTYLAIPCSSVLRFFEQVKYELMPACNLGSGQVNDITVDGHSFRLILCIYVHSLISHVGLDVST
jgi:hypothetical protein